MKTPFDHIARDYDQTFTSTSVGRAQREMIWRYLDLKKLRNKKILELNCGTGEDAIFLARLGNRVLATDISAKMIEELEIKVSAEKLSGPIEAQVRSMEDLNDLDHDFDLVFSNFGGFNCLGPDQLKGVARQISQRLNPGGRLIAVLMPRFSLWETFYFLLKADPDRAFRRSRKSPVPVQLVDGIPQSTWYYSPSQLASLFEPTLNFLNARPVGFFTPPSYLDQWFQTRKWLLDLLVAWDRRTVGLSLLSGGADHYLVEFQKP